MKENKRMDPKLEAVLKDIYNSLTDEQKEKAKACKTIDELMEFAGKEGLELPDELLDAVAGGYGDPELSDPGCIGYSARCETYGTGSSGGGC